MPKLLMARDETRAAHAPAHFFGAGYDHDISERE
jgi:hypothetical protein